MHSAELTTQTVYVLAIAFAMIAAGLSKRRLQWKERPHKRKREH
jgi:hypothetical protein